MIEQFLVSHLFAVLLVFARVGAGVMVLPGFGENYVSPRIRLLIALALSVLMMPIMQPIMPEIPDSPVSLLVLLAAEMMVGVGLGMAARFALNVMHIAGTVISFQSSLAMATQFDPSQGGQSTLISNFLSITALVVLFTLDLHLVTLRALADSYSLFTPGAFPPVEDFALYFARTLSDIFTLGIRFAAPSIVIGLLIYVSAGILGRLMPQMQVFFVLMPPQIFIGFFILMSVFAAIMLEFSNFFSDRIYHFLEMDF